MQVTNVITINRPIADVWNILGPNYANTGDWASAVYVSEGRAGPGPAGAPVAGRVCQTSLGPFTETLVEYSSQNHRISYNATGDKMPGFVKNLKNTWSLKVQSETSTEARMELSADIVFPLNVLMGPLMKMQFRSALRDTIDDLKTYVETGQVSDRKDKADNSKKGRIARTAQTA